MSPHASVHLLPMTAHPNRGDSNLYFARPPLLEATVSVGRQSRLQRLARQQSVLCRRQIFGKLPQRAVMVRLVASPVARNVNINAPSRSVNPRSHLPSASPHITFKSFRASNHDSAMPGSHIEQTVELASCSFPLINQRNMQSRRRMCLHSGKKPTPTLDLR